MTYTLDIDVHEAIDEAVDGALNELEGALSDLVFQEDEYANEGDDYEKGRAIYQHRARVSQYRNAG